MVKSTFTIRDLENLSGVKAHTIRMWERRYAILSPSRTDVNTRYYDVENLQKLLNIVLLMKYGFKPSRLGTMTRDEIEVLVLEVRSEKYDKNHVSHQFKLAMMTFDQQLFMETYELLLSERSFREVFFDYFMPLLQEIGLLWQTRTVSPAHEHFISSLIRLKILANTDALLQKPRMQDGSVYVLFLPLGEIHELGLLYLNFELISQGFKTIYLGENMPVDSLVQLKVLFNQITFVTYATVSPPADEFQAYISELERTVLSAGCELWVMGAMVRNQPPTSNKRIKFFNSLKDALNNF